MQGICQRSDTVGKRGDYGRDLRKRGGNHPGLSIRGGAPGGGHLQRMTEGGPDDMNIMEEVTVAEGKVVGRCVERQPPLRL